MMLLSLVALVIGLPHSGPVADPTAAFARRVAVGSDTAGCALVRMAADFTGDGLLDLAISSTCDLDDSPGWGNAGGRWEVWARDATEDTTHHYVARVFFHPYAVTLTPSDSGTILTTYHRMGASEGYVVRERLAGTSLVRLEERYVRMSSDSSTTWFEDMFPVEKRLPCEACRLSDFLAGTPGWVPGYRVLLDRE